MSRSYDDAISALNTLQSNAAVISDIRANWADTCHLVIPESVEYLLRAGYQPDQLNDLNVIHVAGTKGKGSTSAFCSSLLTTLAPSAKINGKPICQDMFAQRFFEVWDRFGAAPDRNRSETPLRPAYFRFLTILAFHVFLCEKVDATVLEVGIGGLYDMTNVVPSPRVTAITALGLDHTAILGKTLPEIAAQKAGIFKKGCPAFSVQQPEDALRVIAQTAERVQTSSFTVTKADELALSTTLGLAGEHQIDNASLALAAVRSFVTSTKSTKLAAASNADEETWRAGLRKVSFAGRCQTIPDAKRPHITWYLDGAHTAESLACCGAWYGQAVRNNHADAERALVFNCTSDRTGAELLHALVQALMAAGVAARSSLLFNHVIFVPNVIYADGGTKADLINKSAAIGLGVQEGLADAWNTMTETDDALAKAQVFSSISACLDHFAARDASVNILVTGSLHLVGGMLEAAHLT